MHGGRTMKQYNEAFVGIDTAKNKHAVAIADAGREGEIRYLGEIDSAPATVGRMIRKLAGRYKRLHFCYEAGPTGYGLYRQVGALGHDCIVVAPSLVPKRPGERVKTNRRDAVTLARLLRAGDVTAVWVPDAVHEAVRDLVRARTADRKIFAASANSCCRFCCVTDGSTMPADIGPGRICAGWRHKSSITRRSRLFSRMRWTRLRMPRPVCDASMSKWRQSCRAGRWRRWLKLFRRCAAAPLSWP